MPSPVRRHLIFRSQSPKVQISKWRLAGKTIDPRTPGLMHRCCKKSFLVQTRLWIKQHYVPAVACSKTSQSRSRLIVMPSSVCPTMMPLSAQPGSSRTVVTRCGVTVAAIRVVPVGQIPNLHRPFPGIRRPVGIIDERAQHAARNWAMPISSMTNKANRLSFLVSPQDHFSRSGNGGQPRPSRWPHSMSMSIECKAGSNAGEGWEYHGNIMGTSWEQAGKDGKKTTRMSLIARE